MRYYSTLQVLLTLWGLGFTHAHATQPGALQKLASPQAKQTQESAKNESTVEEEMVKQEFEASTDSNIQDFRTIFEAEVLPNASYFAEQGYNATVNTRVPHDDHADLRVLRDELWRYIKFSSVNYMSASSTKTNSLGICQFSRAQSGCSFCETLRLSFVAQLGSVMGPRGFSLRTGPQVSGALTSASAIRGEKAFDEMIARYSSMQLENNTDLKCDGFLYYETYPDQKNGENVVTLSSTLELKGLNGRRTRYHAESAVYLEELNADKPSVGFQSEQSLIRKVSMNQTVKLMSAAATTATDKNQSENVRTDRSVILPESLIEVRGADRYNKVESFKKIFNETFPQYPLTERTMRPGVVVFAIQSFRNNKSSNLEALDRLMSKLRQSQYLQSEGIKFEVVRGASHVVESEQESDEIIMIQLK